MADNNTVTKMMNDTEAQFLLLTMSHIEYKIGKTLSDYSPAHHVVETVKYKDIYFL